MIRHGKELKEWQVMLVDMSMHKPGCWFPQCPSLAYPTMLRTLHPHHIVRRKSRKWDDRRVILICCSGCHGRIHGETYILDGKRYDPISYEDVLDVKRSVDPEYFDEAFLETLRHPPGYQNGNTG